MNILNRKLFSLLIMVGCLSAPSLFSAPAAGATAVQEQPSKMRKVVSTVAAPVATYGTLGLGWLSLNQLGQYVPGMANGSALAGVRPYAAGLAVALAWYKYATPLQQYYYTWFSGDIDRLDTALQNISSNEASIKTALKEILLVKNHLVTNYKPWISFQAMNTLQDDACWKKLSAILNGGNDASDKLPTLKMLGGLTNNNDNDHWYSFGLVKSFITAKNAVVRPFQLLGQSYKTGSWNFEKDDALLVTWGGSKIEDAARNIVTVFNHNDLTTENAQKLQDNAKIIIEYAAQVLAQLKEYKQSIKRVKDLAVLSGKAVQATDDAVQNSAGMWPLFFM